MGHGAGTLGMSFLAGVLTTLSPCVVPLLPLLVCGATEAHSFGLVALTLGVAVSYVSVGIFVATIGASIGMDGEVFRTIAAIMLVLVGSVLVSGKLQDRFALSTAVVGNAGHSLIARITPKGLTGQFVLGLLLGAAWSPCVGPTLGAAVLLASQGKDLLHVAQTMIIFGVGAALPLLALGMLSRELFVLWRGRVMRAGKSGKKLLGGIAILIGVMMGSGVVTGLFMDPPIYLDRELETFLVDASPDWLTDLTTKF
jgi:cytochrome c biogenesis protein CcdA